MTNSGILPPDLPFFLPLGPLAHRWIAADVAKCPRCGAWCSSSVYVEYDLGTESGFIPLSTRVAFELDEHGRIRCVDHACVEPPAEARAART